MCKCPPLPRIFKSCGFESYSSLFFVFGVILLISMIPISLNYYCLWPWMTWHSKEMYIKWIGPWYIMIGLLWYYYFKTMITSPGKIPREYNPWKGGIPLVMELKKSSSEPRFCRICMEYKPPRSHHCRECNMCVLKMDHHCPWVNNCVGHGNIGHFYRFLFWTTLAVIYALFLIGKRIWAQMRYNLKMGEYYRTPFHSQKIDLSKYVTPMATGMEVATLIINTILLVVLIFTVGVLWGFQTYYCHRNMTTIESMEKDRMDTLVDRGIMSKEETKSPYRLEKSSDNWKQVLGEGNWFIGVLFPRKPWGDGLWFPVNQQAKDRIETVERNGQVIPIITWPPQTYLNYYSRKPKQSIQETAVQVDEMEDPTISISTEAILKEESLLQARPRHGRRGSEGFIVKELSEMERERMMNDEMEREVQEMNMIIEKGE